MAIAGKIFMAGLGNMTFTVDKIYEMGNATSISVNIPDINFEPTCPTCFGGGLYDGKGDSCVCTTCLDTGSEIRYSPNYCRLGKI